jgi:UDP-N-acetylmuramoyl-L-alanyl-D-glutamate--2,6-diaminopimelate ligase
MKFSEILKGVTVVETAGELEVEVRGVTADSRVVSPGSLFVAVPGLAAGGEERALQFIEAAVQKGAVAVVAESKPQPPVVFAQVDDARAALALVAANFYGRPAERLSLVGVTGTSGKTTTTKMLESVFDATGEPAGLIGTIEYRAGDERLAADRTTPDAVVLQEWFAKMAAAGVRHAVMEVSSHALVQKRVHGVHFEAAVFTNLSQDHFDYHKGFEDYFAAKSILFDQIDRHASAPRAVVNADDRWGQRLIARLGASTFTFGRADAGVSARHIHPAADFELDVRGMRGIVHTPIGDVRIESKLLGMPNLYNWMGAIGAALVVGIPIPVIEEGIRSLRSVRGRFEYVASPDPSRGPTVIVDYAHKPDALRKLLEAVRTLSGERRLLLVFGCGGDRDQEKRPMMGGIAGELADYSIITSDNPRSEKPEAIIEAIEAGFAGGAKNHEKLADRRAAIARAIAMAGDDDVVVIAGKGHETYQVAGDQILHFDDREEAELALKKHHEKRTEKSA